MNYIATHTTFKKPVEYTNPVFHNVLRSYTEGKEIKNP